MPPADTASDQSRPRGIRLAGTVAAPGPAARIPARASGPSSGPPEPASATQVPAEGPGVQVDNARCSATTTVRRKALWVKGGPDE